VPRRNPVPRRRVRRRQKTSRIGDIRRFSLTKPSPAGHAPGFPVQATESAECFQKPVCDRSNREIRDER